MAVFLVIMFGCFVFFGAVICLIEKGIRCDSYAYDMLYLWDRFDVTLEQMEFERTG